MMDHPPKTKRYLLHLKDWFKNKLYYNNTNI